MIQTGMRPTMSKDSSNDGICLIGGHFGGRVRFWSLCALLVAGLTVLPQGALAARVRDKDPGKSARLEAPSFQAVFVQVARAWRAGDQKTLVGLVHPDGLKIISGGTTDRTVHYSPSQAFYYFRNLFQNSGAVAFTMTRVQDAPQGDRAHALARWEYRTETGTEVAKLVIVLARHQSRWYLSEITTIK